MGRIARGFRCLSISSELLRANPRLVVFPALAVMAEVVVAAVYIFGLNNGPSSVTRTGFSDVVPLALFLAVCTFLSTSAAAVVVAAADLQLDGKPSDIPSALRRLQGRWAAVIAWSLFSATVGILIQLLQERLGFIGRIVTTVADIAWSVASLLVVPVLVVEGAGPADGFRRSASLVRQRWGEAISGETGMGLALFLCSLPLLVVAAIGFVGGPYVGVATVSVALLAYFAVSASLSAILSLVLYRYAAGGDVAGGFTVEDLNQMLTGTSRTREQPRDWRSRSPRRADNIRFF